MTPRRVDQGAALAAAGALPSEITDELRTRFRTLRIMLHHSGLAATYAFVASRSAGNEPLPRAYAAVAQIIRARLVERGLLPAAATGWSTRQLLDRLGSMSLAEYAHASAEATVLLAWLARLAEAMTVESR